MAKDGCGDTVRICTLWKKRDLGEIARLSVKPRYICTKCGRVAHCKKHLCKPEKITK